MTHGRTLTPPEFPKPATFMELASSVQFYSALAAELAAREAARRARYNEPNPLTQRRSTDLMTLAVGELRPPEMISREQAFFSSLSAIDLEMAKVRNALDYGRWQSEAIHACAPGTESHLLQP